MVVLRRKRRTVLGMRDLSGENRGIRGGEEMMQETQMIDSIPTQGRAAVRMTRLMWARCPVTKKRDLYLCRIVFVTSPSSCPEYGSIYKMMRAYKNVPIAGENIVLDMKDHLKKAGCDLVWVKLTTVIHRGFRLSVETT